MRYFEFSQGTNDYYALIGVNSDHYPRQLAAITYFDDVCYPDDESVDCYEISYEEVIERSLLSGEGTKEDIIKYLDDIKNERSIVILLDGCL
jgi:hypothetical protein